MTDNEIIKAMECCKTENGNDCEDCPYQNVGYKPGSGGCCNALMGDALDLINRLKKENEELKAKQEMADGYADALVERTKIKASKEVIKRFEKKIKDVKFTLGQTWEIQCALKEVLKEMEEN